jgi:hypothetical protein
MTAPKATAEGLAEAFSQIAAALLLEREAARDSQSMPQGSASAAVWREVEILPNRGRQNSYQTNGCFETSDVDVQRLGGGERRDQPGLDPSQDGVASKDNNGRRSFGSHTQRNIIGNGKSDSRLQGSGSGRARQSSGRKAR